MSPKSKSRRCCSPGILQNCQNDNQTLSKRCDEKLKIRVYDPSRPTEHKEAEKEQRRFADLKKQYFDECANINRNLVPKCSQPTDCDDDPDMQVLKAIRGNPKTFDFGKNEVIKKQEATDVRKRNSRIMNAEDLPTSTGNRRNIKRGCGAVGCDCLNCVCGVNCQKNCQCMRKI